MKNIKNDSDRCDVHIQLSYTLIKYLILKFKIHQTDSPEGEISQHCATGLRKYLIRKARQGNVPEHIIEEMMTRKDESEQEPIEYIDKSTILIETKPKENENE